MFSCLLVAIFLLYSAPVKAKSDVQFVVASDSLVPVNSSKNSALGKSCDSKLIEKVLKSAVEIKTFEINEEKVNKIGDNINYEKSMTSQAAASGFFISPNGYILTNNHVVDNADRIVVFYNGKDYRAELIGGDFYSDIALIKINFANKDFLELKDGLTYNVGDEILTIGNPHGFGLSVSKGIISAKNRSLEKLGFYNLIQVDAHINKGNSGGPLLSCNGDVIGMNSILYTTNEDKNGLAFAVPIDSTFIDIVNRLKESGYIQRGWVGISGITASEELFKLLKINRSNGVFVTDVEYNSPAYESGILPSDIIISCGDNAVKTTAQLDKLIKETPIGAKVTLSVLRNGKYIKFRVKVIDTPENGKYLGDGSELILRDFMGMTLAVINDDLIDKYKLYGNLEGMYILNVKDGSMADFYDIKQGDTLLFLNQIKINGENSFKRAVQQAKANGEFLMIIGRQDNKNLVLRLNSNIIE